MQLFEILEGAAAARPEQLAVVDASGAGARFTYGQTHARVRALAAGRRAEGVRAGDRVAILELNSIEYFEGYFAAAAGGAIAVPLNVRLARPELEAIAGDCSPSGLDRERPPGGARAHLRQRPPPDRHGLRRGGRPWGFLRRGGRPRRARVRAHPVHTGDGRHLYYTSGTTGRSKGVPLTHGNVYRHAEHAAARPSSSSRRPTSGDTSLRCSTWPTPGPSSP